MRNLLLFVCLVLIIGFASAASPDVMFRYNANHSGDYSPVAGTTTTSVSQLWNLSIGYTGAALDSSPVISNGVVYIGSADKNLYAVNATTGALLWKNLTGGSIASSPAVSNGIVYFGSTDTNVYALDASTGAQVWTYNAVNYIYSSPTIANNTVYIPTITTLYKLNAATGALLQSKSIGTNVYSTPAITNDFVYVGSSTPAFYGIDVSDLGWHYGFYPPNNVISSPSVVNDIIYFGSGRHVYALNASDNMVPIWDFNDTYETAFYSTSPAVANGIVYVAGNGNNILRALNASTGAYVWNYTASAAVYTPSVANGIVYFGCNDNNIYALNASTGAPYWTFPTGGFVNDAPSIANGVLYVASQDGKLYALDLSGAAPVPSVTNVSPSSGLTTGGDMVTITGTGFTGATAITFGGTSAGPPSSISDTTIMVTTPAHAAGTVDVTVTTIRGTSATGSADRFTYTSVPLPSAGFVGTPLSGLAPLTVTFNDTSTGAGIISWNWTFGDGSAENSTMQNPIHTYLNNGSYSVTLNVTNTSGSNNLTKSNYILVGSLTRTGVFRGLGSWYLDMNNNGTWDGNSIDKEFYWGKIPGDIPVTGDWTGDGITETGIFRGLGYWYLDMNNNGTWDGNSIDKEFYWGKTPGDIPVTGDWNGDRITETGIFRGLGYWYLDMNNNGTWDGNSIDKEFYWGKTTGDIPVTGDWTGDGITETGIFRPGTGFYLDMNNNGTWDSTPTDKVFYWVTQPGDIPITGDWTGDGITKIGVFRPGTGFYLDMNNNGQYDGPSTDIFLPWGLQLGDKPITGKW
jgi:outer membrane protein assembly factor BamB